MQTLVSLLTGLGCAALLLAGFPRIENDAAASSGTGLITESTEAVSQEGMIGEVRLFAGNFAPRGWALCDGQLLSISSYQALFSILGTTYGGDGRTTFALPDLRGRVAIHPGRGIGLQPNQLGEKRGSEFVPGKSVGLGDGRMKAYILPVESVDVRDPSLGLNYIICLSGIYPSRN